jgi:hypothetical protein
MGASPKTRTSTGGSWGSRNTSSVPPDRHGLATVTWPGRSAGAAPTSGVMRSTTLSPVSSDCRAWARTLVSAHTPPTNPTRLPSASTTAVSPGLALVGRSALITVTRTKGRRAERSSSAAAAVM